MTHILVLGGRGYYGAQVTTALQRLGDDVRVSPVGRNPNVAANLPGIDLRDADTWGPLRDADLIVNCADSVNAPPLDAMRFALGHGRVWMEMGASTTLTTQALKINAEDTDGALIVGVGVFPGLSTALAAHVADAGDCATLDLGVRLSPLSGAGPGNCALMTRYLVEDGLVVRDGEPVATAVVHGGAALTFAGAERAHAVGIALPDTALIHRATGAPNVASYMALDPGFLRWNFRIIAALIPWLGPLKRPAIWLTERALIVLRAVLLRDRPTPVALVAVADRDTPQARSAKLTFGDGHLATALGVAAAARLWLDRDLKPDAPTRGVLTVPDLFTLPALLDACRALAPGGKLDLAEEGIAPTQTP